MARQILIETELRLSSKQLAQDIRDAERQIGAIRVPVEISGPSVKNLTVPVDFSEGLAGLKQQLSEAAALLSEVGSTFGANARAEIEKSKVEVDFASQGDKFLERLKDTLSKRVSAKVRGPNPLQGIFTGAFEEVGATFTRQVRRDLKDAFDFDLASVNAISSLIKGIKTPLDLILTDDQVKNIAKRTSETIAKPINRALADVGTAVLESVKEQQDPVARLFEELNKSFTAERFKQDVSTAKDDVKEIIELTKKAAISGQATKDIQQRISGPLQDRRRRLIGENALPKVERRAAEILESGKTKERGNRTANVVTPDTKELVIGVGGLSGVKGRAGRFVGQRLQGKVNEGAEIISVSNREQDPFKVNEEKTGKQITRRAVAAAAPPLIQGFSNDSLEIASQAFAALQRNPEITVKIVGESGGGLLAAEAQEILNQLGVGDRVQSLGSGTPTTPGALNPEGFTGILSADEHIGEMASSAIVDNFNDIVLRLAGIALPVPPDLEGELLGVRDHLIQGYEGTAEFINLLQGLPNPFEDENFQAARELSDALQKEAANAKTPEKKEFFSLIAFESLQQTRRQFDVLKGEQLEEAKQLASEFEQVFVDLTPPTDPLVQLFRDAVEVYEKELKALKKVGGPDALAKGRELRENLEGFQEEIAAQVLTLGGGTKRRQLVDVGTRIDTVKSGLTNDIPTIDPSISEGLKQEQRQKAAEAEAINRLQQIAGPDVGVEEIQQFRQELIEVAKGNLRILSETDDAYDLWSNAVLQFADTAETAQQQGERLQREAQQRFTQSDEAGLPNPLPGMREGEDFQRVDGPVARITGPTQEIPGLIEDLDFEVVNRRTTQLADGLNEVTTDIEIFNPNAFRVLLQNAEELGLSIERVTTPVVRFADPWPKVTADVDDFGFVVTQATDVFDQEGRIVGDRLKRFGQILQKAGVKVEGKVTEVLGNILGDEGILKLAKITRILDNNLSAAPADVRPLGLDAREQFALPANQEVEEALAAAKAKAVSLGATQDQIENASEDLLEVALGTKRILEDYEQDFFNDDPLQFGPIREAVSQLVDVIEVEAIRLKGEQIPLFELDTVATTPNVIPDRTRLDTEALSPMQRRLAGIQEPEGRSLIPDESQARADTVTFQSANTVVFENVAEIRGLGLSSDEQEAKQVRGKISGPLNGDQLPLFDVDALLNQNQIRQEAKEALAGASKGLLDEIRTELQRSPTERRERLENELVAEINKLLSLQRDFQGGGREVEGFEPIEKLSELTAGKLLKASGEASKELVDGARNARQALLGRLQGIANIVRPQTVIEPLDPALPPASGGAIAKVEEAQVLGSRLFALAERVEDVTLTLLPLGKQIKGLARNPFIGPFVVVGAAEFFAPGVTNAVLEPLTNIVSTGVVEGVKLLPGGANIVEGVQGGSAALEAFSNAKTILPGGFEIGVPGGSEVGAILSQGKAFGSGVIEIVTEFVAGTVLRKIANDTQKVLKPAATDRAQAALPPAQSQVRSLPAGAVTPGLPLSLPSADAAGAIIDVESQPITTKVREQRVGPLDRAKAILANPGESIQKAVKGRGDATGDLIGNVIVDEDRVTQQIEEATRDLVAAKDALLRPYQEAARDLIQQKPINEVLKGVNREGLVDIARDIGVHEATIAQSLKKGRQRLQKVLVAASERVEGKDQEIIRSVLELPESRLNKTLNKQIENVRGKKAVLGKSSLNDDQLLGKIINASKDLLRDRQQQLEDALASGFLEDAAQLAEEIIGITDKQLVELIKLKDNFSFDAIKGGKQKVQGNISAIRGFGNKARGALDQIQGQTSIISQSTVDDFVEPEKVTQLFEQVGGTAGRALNKGLLQQILKGAAATKALANKGDEGALGFIRGFAQRAPELKKAAGGAAESIVTEIEDVLEIQSPSKLLERIARFAMKGLEIGIEKGSAAIASVSAATAKFIVNDFEKVEDAAKTAGKVAGEGLAKAKDAAIKGADTGSRQRPKLLNDEDSESQRFRDRADPLDSAFAGRSRDNSLRRNLKAGDAAEKVAAKTKRAAKEINQATKSTQKRLGGFFKRIQKGFDDLTEKVPALGKFVNIIKSVGVTALAAFGLSQLDDIIIDLGRRAFETTARIKGLEAALDFSVGGDASVELEFINAEVDRLSINFETAVTGFTQLNNAARGTVLEGKGVKEVFSAISQATRVYNKTADEQQRIISQVSQGINKQQIELEDLKTISEAGIPIFQAFSDALGIEPAEFRRRITAGKVGLKELRLAALQLNDATTEGVGAATKTLIAKTAEFQTASTRAFVAFGELAEPIFAKVVALATAALNFLQREIAIFGKAFILAFKFVQPLLNLILDTLKLLATPFIELAKLFNLLIIRTGIWRGIVAALGVILGAGLPAALATLGPLLAGLAGIIVSAVTPAFTALITQSLAFIATPVGAALAIIAAAAAVLAPHLDDLAIKFAGLTKEEVEAADRSAKFNKEFFDALTKVAGGVALTAEEVTRLKKELDEQVASGETSASVAATLANKLETLQAEAIANQEAFDALKESVEESTKAFEAQSQEIEDRNLRAQLALAEANASNAQTQRESRQQELQNEKAHTQDLTSLYADRSDQLETEIAGFQRAISSGILKGKELEQTEKSLKKAIADQRKFANKTLQSRVKLAQNIRKIDDQAEKDRQEIAKEANENVTREIEQIQSQQQIALQQTVNERLITSEQEAAKLLEIDRLRIENQIQLEKDKVAELLALEPTGNVDKEKARAKELEAIQKSISALTLDLLKKEAEERQKLAQILEAESNKAQGIIESQETARQTEVQKLVNSRVLTEQEANAQILDSDQQRILAQITLEEERIAHLRSLPNANEEDVREAVQQTATLRLELLNNQFAKEEALKELTLKRLEDQNLIADTIGDRQVAGLQRQVDLQKSISAILSRQNTLAETKKALADSELALKRRLLEIEIEQGKGGTRAQERLNKLNQDALLSSQQSARLDKQRQIEAEASANKVANIEARIAEIKAQQGLADAQNALIRAQQSGNAALIAQAELQLSLQQRGVELAQDLVGETNKKLKNEKETAELQKKELLNQQKLERINQRFSQNPNKRPRDFGGRSNSNFGDTGRAKVELKERRREESRATKPRVKPVLDTQTQDRFTKGIAKKKGFILPKTPSISPRQAPASLISNLQTTAPNKLTQGQATTPGELTKLKEPVDAGFDSVQGYLKDIHSLLKNNGQQEQQGLTRITSEQILGNGYLKNIAAKPTATLPKKINMPSASKARTRGL